jgi:3-methyladenine DNA glycosylase AlkC
MHKELKTKRKGSKSIKDIPKEILELLNSGAIETANLVEWLAVDCTLLLQKILQQNNRLAYLKPILTEIESLKKQTVNTINEAIGTEIFNQTTQNKDAAFLKIIANHSSDVGRCWATYAICKNPNLSLLQMLQQIQVFAQDNHFGVREICWLAARPKISENLKESLHILSKWAMHPNENVRRFASEATRPRGVWCQHIETLKLNPELGLVILEPLQSDNSKYVQDSVGNWLNDASKTKPDFVMDICQQWQSKNDSKATAYIVKKALRTIQKNG